MFTVDVKQQCNNNNNNKAYNRGHKQTDLIIMDIAKASDKVPHRRLLYKLRYFGIRGTTVEWISSWLSGCYMAKPQVQSLPFWCPSGIRPRADPIFDL